MFNWIRNRAADRAKAQELYGAVVTLARTPGFYSTFGVRDTPEGRFEMVALVLFLALERLRTAGEEERLVQGAIEALVTDMDDCMREMGVGDMVVPKRVKRAAAAFYERAGAYRAALAAPGDAELTVALAQHAYGGASAADARPLAAVVRQMQHALEVAPRADLASGRALASLRTLIAAG